ncbi:MAG: polyhydroxyalkanoic acid system family protein [Chloroflexi bacterium]|nr:polyhydroxyalkanoic acid system family protein [Chloroflexota bacterium]
MEVRRFHNTTVEAAVELVNQLLPGFVRQAGDNVSNLQSRWDGPVLYASFTAHTPLGNLNIAATFTVTDSEVIIYSKLPFRARVREGQIRAAVEKELDRYL